jgi:hypothetical protein
MATLKNTTIDSVDFIRLPVGTTAQRPASPVGGMIRYNSTTTNVEYYDAVNSVWKVLVA